MAKKLNGYYIHFETKDYYLVSEFKEKKKLFKLDK